MKLFFILSVLLLACLVVSCNSSDDDDDDNDDNADDDFLDDDDDDDAADDDDDDVNETWTDEATGLVWQVDPPQEIMTWEKAIQYCEDLDLGNFTDWRMPTISELRSIVRGCPATFIGGECGVTDECTETECQNDVCIGCDELQGPNEGFYLPNELRDTFVENVAYFTASELDIDGAVWSMSYAYGCVVGMNTTTESLIRCVR